MTIEPIIFYGLIIAIFVLCLTLTAVAFFYSEIFNKLNSTKIEEERLKEKMSQKSINLTLSISPHL